MQRHSQSSLSVSEDREGYSELYLEWQKRICSTALLLVSCERKSIVETNLSGERLFVSSESRPLLGLSVGEIFPRGELNFLFDPKTAVLTSVMIEAQGAKLSGGVFACQVQGSKLALEGQHYVLLAVSDLTAQKKLRRDLEAKQQGLKESLKELVAKNDELLALDKAKDKFLALVAHELRTPLNTVVSTSELIKGGYVEGEEMTELIDNLGSQSKFLLDLVNDILDLTKVQSGKMDYFIEEGDPRQVIQHQACIFSEMAEKSKVTIQAPELEPESETQAPDCLCYFDPLRLEQILGNLISNAVKFNRPGGQVILSVQSEEDFVWISIQDTGIGIPSEKLGKIFDEFETVGQISNHHKGTGLGLSIVKALIEGQGGEILVKSVAGQGTSFRFKLPRQKVLPAEVYRSRNTDGVIIF